MESDVGLMIRTTFLILILSLLAGCSRQSTPEPTAAIVSPTQAPPATVTQTQPAASPAPTLAPPTPSPTLSPTVFVAPEPFMGIHVNQMENPEQKERFRQSGATWSRFDYFRWEKIEPTNLSPDDYMWDAVNEEALKAASEGEYTTIGVVQFTPAWAQKYLNTACGPVAEEALDDFAEFMGALVTRYSQPPYHIQYWEIGNEPDVDHTIVEGHSIYGCWGEMDDPTYGGSYYGEMLKAVYPAVKAADPDARLLVGGLLMDCDPVNPPEAPDVGGSKDCHSSKFLEGILNAGAGNSFDGVSFHAYDYYYGAPGSYGNDGWHSSADVSGPALIAKARYLKSVLASAGIADKELLNTEVAILCGRDGKEPICQADDFQNTKAYYIAQSNAAALAEGVRANIWFSLTGWRGSGLVDQNLNSTRAFSAYEFTANELDGAQYLGPINEYNGVMGYKFANKGKAIWLVWSLGQQSHRIALPVAYQAAYDVFGDPIASDGLSKKELDISIAPVFIEWID